MKEPQTAKSDNADEDKKVALVTGSSRGIGAAISKKLAENGFKVILNYRSDDIGAENTVNEIVSRGGQAVAFKADVSSETEVSRMFSFIENQFGRLSVLINNASPKIVEKKATDAQWIDYERQLEGQLKSAVLCSNLAFRMMSQNKNGVIINIGSVVSLSVPPQKWAAYTVAKAAIESFTKCFAIEVGPSGIRVNMVSPGMTETRMVADVPEKMRLLQAAQTPLRRLSTVADVANAVYFLVSNEASFITGENLLVSGGKAMH